MSPTTSATDRDVLLVSCPPWRTECPNLALAYLSTYLRSHGIPTWVSDFNVALYNAIETEHRCYWELTSSTFWARPSLLDGTFSPRVSRIIEEWVDELADRPGQVIGFSTQSANVMFTLGVVNLLRERGVDKTIVLGGPSVRLFTPGDGSSVGLTGFKPRDLDEMKAAAEIREHLDLVDVFVEGEGEETLLEIVQRLEQGVSLEGIPGAVAWRAGGGTPLFIPRPAIADLDAIPYPTFEEFDLSAYTARILPFLTSRGCVRKCTMCYERILWPGFRHRSIEHVLAEMRHHMERHGIEQFSCNDLLLNGNLPHLAATCDAIVESGLKPNWWGNAVVHRLMDRDLFARMKAGGITALVYGMESGSQKILHRMRKGYLIDDADHVLQLGREYGINNVINLIVGFPGETQEDHEATMDFVRRNAENIDHVGVLAMCMIYPHSTLSERWRDFGLESESLEQQNPFLVNVEWRDLNGLDSATRHERFWELFRLIRGHGIGVTGVEDEEVLDETRIAELRERLTHPTVWVREDSVNRLAPARDPSLADDFERALDDSSFIVQGQALLNLGRLDPGRARYHARRLIYRKNPFVDYAATLAIARAGGTDVFDFLERFLEEEGFRKQSPEVQNALQPYRASYRIIEELEDSLGQGRWQDLERLTNLDEPWLRERGLRCLQGERHSPVSSPVPEAIPYLTPFLRDGSPEVRLRALWLLRRAWMARPREEAGPHPAEADALLDDPDPRIRAEAALWLGPERVPALAQARRDSLNGGASLAWEGADPHGKLLLLCVSLGMETLEPPRAETLDSPADSGVRAVRRPLGVSLELLVRALRDDEGSVRLAGLTYLSRVLGEGDPLPEGLLPCLSFPSRQVRALAAECIGAARARHLEKALQPLLDDPEPGVSEAAVSALARMWSPFVHRYLRHLFDDRILALLPGEVRQAVMPCVEVHRRLASYEKSIRQGMDGELSSVYEAENSFGRATLLGLVLGAGNASALPRFMRTVLGDPDPVLREWGMEILNDLEDESFIPDAEALLDDPDEMVRYHAVRFLAGLRHAAAGDHFVDKMDDVSPGVREWAARGLARLNHPEARTRLEGLLEPETFSTLPPDFQADLAHLREA